MQFITKFFDPAIAEPPAAIEQPSIAQLMATQGVKSESGEYRSTPIVLTEKKEEPKPAPEPTPAATATVDSNNADTAKSEPPSLIEEPKDAPIVEIPQEQSQVQSWQEVLKSQQPDTVFKELGYDDKMVKLVSQLKDLDPKVIGLVEAYKEGKHVDYLRDLTTDYSKMSPEEVMRHQLRQDYPTASSQQLDALFKREVTKAYSLDSDDEDEKMEGQLLLEARADKHRATLIANQQQFLIPKFTEPKAPEPDKEGEEARQKFEVYRTQFNDNQYTKNIFATNQISIGEGEEKFTYPVKPDALTNVLFNGERWMEKMSDVKNNPDGSKTFTPNAKKQMLVAAVAEYGEDFFIQYAKHFKSLGGSKVVDTIDNAKPPDNNTPSAAPKAPETVAEAMARQGRVNYGGQQ